MSKLTFTHPVFSFIEVYKEERRRSPVDELGIFR